MGLCVGGHGPSLRSIFTPFCASLFLYLLNEFKIEFNLWKWHILTCMHSPIQFWTANSRTSKHILLNVDADINQHNLFSIPIIQLLSYSNPPIQYFYTSSPRHPHNLFFVPSGGNLGLFDQNPKAIFFDWYRNSPPIKNVTSLKMFYLLYI